MVNMTYSFGIIRETQMTRTVLVSPAQPQTAGEIEECAVTVTNRDFLYRNFLENGDWDWDIFFPRATQRSVVVAAPRIHMTLSCQCQIVKGSHSNGDNLLVGKSFEDGRLLALEDAFAETQLITLATAVDEDLAGGHSL
jgi:hypothetical protein